MTRLINWGGAPFAILIEPAEGDPYLVPPIVLDANDVPIGGGSRAVLQAVVDSGVTIEHPMIKGATLGDLADIEERMERISEVLGVPIGVDREAA